MAPTEIDTAKQPEHDYRAIYQPDGSYRAICSSCGHDAGVVDVSKWTVVFGRFNAAD